MHDNVLKAIPAAWRLAKAQSDVVLDTNGNKTTQGNGYGVVDLYEVLSIDPIELVLL